MKSRSLFGMIAGAVFLAFVMAGATGCDSSTTPSGDSHVFTSTSVNAHSHSVTIDKADVQTPPMAGISESTSSSAGHTHSFAMTEAQLTTVNGGGSVTITTGSSDTGGAHTHDITITKWF